MILIQVYHPERALESTVGAHQEGKDEGQHCSLHVWAAVGLGQPGLAVRAPAHFRHSTSSVLQGGYFTFVFFTDSLSWLLMHQLSMWRK